MSMQTSQFFCVDTQILLFSLKHLNTMDSKRKSDLDIDEISNINCKKHTLDSDEEDSDEYEREDSNDVEGEEDGISNVRDDVKITPFNMREELQEGHFDKEGHYHWNKTNEIKDNWLDNIDWLKVDESHAEKEDRDADKPDSLNVVNQSQVYQNILGFMMESETVSQTIRRLGKQRKKLSTAERIRNKKNGIVDTDADKIMQLTEMVNAILTATGNMDIYEMTYEAIEEKVNSTPSTSKTQASNLDMYSDDFSEKEKFLKNDKPNELVKTKQEASESKEVLWEYKVNQDDSQLQGPFSTKKMLEMSESGKFGNGVYVRRVGEKTNFYKSSRIDFDLYM
ncbi:CD2 antigen cytoplasmic tail-binding protein 2 homolog [Stomoxys calcitrans]|uniref:CD2 antigen cytoplasmic tail-binding protein 2 homolog n=1 Tax=Stomoxys calcitrans TaxID=35570 RepID=UPI0027E325F2|nr:CD2 antigen cytoplasmic tail-binding protein 2 homolog [Stomoxys calcitrans]